MVAITTNAGRHSWLTSEFLETILKSSENQLNVKVKDYQLHDAVEKGENFTSYLMRITVNYTVDCGSKTQQKTFIAKTLLDNDAINQIFKSVRMFDKEIAFYRDIQPKFKNYTNIIDANFKCAPRSFAINDNPIYIILEDLKIQNYRNMNRHIGFDFDATAMVLRKLAKLHAINAMIYEESPELFEPHKICILSRENQALLPGITNGIRDCQQICLKWSGYERFYDKLQHWMDNIVEIVELTYYKDDSTFNTLTHGDLWVNNIMFKFDENNTPVDVLFVDYQVGNYGPPTLDLTYLFYTSTANTLFEQDWDRLLQIYHAELVKSLQLLKYPKCIPSLTELQIQMYKKALCAAILAFTLVPPRHMDDKKGDIDTLMLNSDDILKSRYALYDKPVVYERLQYFLDYFDRKGFFEAIPS